MTEEVRNPFETGPYIQVAAFCERVLRESDKVISLIRIIDVVTHNESGPNAPDDMPAIRYPLNLVLTFNSGSARGRMDMTIIPELPSGELLDSTTMTVRFEGEGRGANAIVDIDITYQLEGLYWFIIQLDGQMITRVPLQIRYVRTTGGSVGPSG